MSGGSAQALASASQPQIVSPRHERMQQPVSVEDLSAQSLGAAAGVARPVRALSASFQPQAPTNSDSIAVATHPANPENSGNSPGILSRQTRPSFPGVVPQQAQQVAPAGLPVALAGATM